MAFRLIKTSDTRWRDVTSLLLNGWTATRVLVRRDGKWGHVTAQGLDGTDATSPYFVDGLSGFFLPGQGFPIQVGTAMERLWVPAAGDRISIPTSIPVSSTPVQASQYLGDLSWPSTYPGQEVS